MKYFLIILLLSTNAVYATLTYAQRTVLSLDMEERAVSEVLDEIERQSEFRFYYNSKLVDTQRKVTVRAQQASVFDVLNQLFLASNVGYKVVDKDVILVERDAKITSPQLAVTLQGITITGIVTDAFGEPLPGVSVMIKGATQGTATDKNGAYSLSVQGENATLVFSFIGFITQEFLVGNQLVINVSLSEDIQQIEEVVVIGYGTVQRKNFTGSVSTINVANSPIALSHRTNTMDMLRGTTTGITVAREAALGENQAMEIHGQRSIMGTSSAPMIVVDGVKMGSMRDINPATVESISVLKDATSLAAYGSQAANGVIMITTKKGKLGKPIINFDASMSAFSADLMLNLMSPEDFIRKNNLVRGVADGNPQPWMTVSAYENYQAGRTTDWLDYACQTGWAQNYNISVSGATERLNYSLALGHVDQKGVLIGDRHSRQTVNIRLQNDITDWLQVGARVDYVYNNYDGVAAQLQPYLSPYFQPTRPNGELERYIGEQGLANINPLWNTYLGGTVDDYERYSLARVRGDVLIKAPWIKGLTYRLNAVYSEENYKFNRFTHEGNYVPEGYPGNDDRYSPQTLAGFLSSANGSNQRRVTNSYVIDNILNYTAQFNLHFIDVSAVYTRDQTEYDNRTLNGTNFSSLGNTLLGYNGLGFAQVQTVGNEKIRTANVGYLGRINYAYNDRYHLTASVRRDGSSVFGVNNKWGVFPAVGAAWTVSMEDFWDSLKEDINYLKIKASWGKNGNQSLGAYSTLSTINMGQRGNHPYVFGNTGSVSWGQFVTAIGNGDLGWETTICFNAGFEIGLWKDRIRFEMDTYKSKTTDQIFNRTIPPVGSGFTTMRATMGQVDNWGIEFTLNTINIKSNDFQWSSMLNFYLNRNKLVELYGDGKDDIGNSRFLGKSLGAIYNLEVIGMVQEEDTEYIAVNSTQPGYPKYRKLDGSNNPITLDEDRKILGYDKDNFRMNMVQSVVYGNWELYALFTGVFGGGGYGLKDNPGAFITNSDIQRNYDHVWWTPENRSNKYPTYTFAGANYSPVMGYGFVRLQDLNLSYTFRQPFFREKGIEHLRMYFSVKNLFTITNWTTGDPENKITFAATGALLTYPLYKTFSFGVNLSF